MKQHTTSAIERFFKDKNGRWTIIQIPNVLLSSWIILLVVNFFVHNQHIQQLQSAVLFAWAYLELTGGDSPFRKVLGGTVLVYVIVDLLFL